MDVKTHDVSVTDETWQRIQKKAAAMNGSPHNLADKLLRQMLDAADPDTEARIEALEAEIVRLRDALRGCMIGGNHLALHLPDPNPSPDIDPLDALKSIGAGIEYDIWCAWRSLMLARAALAEGGDD